MSMTVKKRKDVKTPKVLMHRIADIRGGVSVASAELGGDYLPEGALLSAPDDNGICHVAKFAILYAAAEASDKDIQLAKFSNISVGDYVALKVGGTAIQVTAVDTTSTKYDTVTLASALGATEQGTAIVVTDSKGALAYEPIAVNGTGKYVASETNIDTDAWVIGVTKGLTVPDGFGDYLKGIIMLK